MSEDHDHELPLGPEVLADPLGRPVDMRMLARLIGAAVEGCAGCREELLAQLVRDPFGIVRLVEMACVGTEQVIGYAPADLFEPELPGETGQAFRTLATAGADGQNRASTPVCTAMEPGRRREAAEDALNILVELLTVAR